MSTKKSQVSINDFSEKSLKKTLYKKSLEDNTFRYSSALFLASIVSGVMFGFSGIIFGVAVLLAVTSLGSWVWNYFIKSNDYIMERLNELQSIIDKETKEKRALISKEFERMNYQDGKLQLQKLVARFENFVEVLDEKFDRTELTYKRFRGVGNEILVVTMENVEQIVSALKNIEDIDHVSVKKQLSDLEISGKNPEKRDVLKKRLLLRDSELRRIDQLVLQNEKAITQMDETVIEISKIKAGKDSKPKDFNVAMEGLLDINKRIKDH